MGWHDNYDKKAGGSSGGGGGGTPAVIDYYNSEIEAFVGNPTNKTVTPDDLARISGDLAEELRDIHARSDFNSVRTNTLTNLNVARTETETYKIPNRWEKFRHRAVYVDWTIVVTRPQKTSDLSSITNYRVAITVERKVTSGSSVVTTTVATFPKTPNLTVNHTVKFVDVIAPDSAVTKIEYVISFTYDTSTTAAQGFEYSAPVKISPANVGIFPANSTIGEMFRVTESPPRSTDQMLFYRGFLTSKPVHSSRMIEMPGAVPPFETATKYEQIAVVDGDIDYILTADGVEQDLRNSSSSPIKVIPALTSDVDFAIYKYYFDATDVSGSGGEIQLRENGKKYKAYADSLNVIEGEYAFSRAHFFKKTGSTTEWELPIGWWNDGTSGKKRRLQGRHELRTYKHSSGIEWPGVEKLLTSPTNFNSSVGGTSLINLSRRIYVDDFKFIFVGFQFNSNYGIAMFKPASFGGVFASGDSNSYRHIMFGIDKEGGVYADHDYSAQPNRYIRFRMGLNRFTLPKNTICDTIKIVQVRKNTAGYGAITTSKVTNVWGIR